MVGAELSKNGDIVSTGLAEARKGMGADPSDTLSTADDTLGIRGMAAFLSPANSGQGQVRTTHPQRNVAEEATGG